MYVYVASVRLIRKLYCSLRIDPINICYQFSPVDDDSHQWVKKGASLIAWKRQRSQGRAKKVSHRSIFF